MAVFDMQVADKVVGHAINLYSLFLRVKGLNRDSFFSDTRLLR